MIDRIPSGYRYLSEDIIMIDRIPSGYRYLSEDWVRIIMDHH